MKKILLPLLAVAGLLPSCARYYAPALMNADILYQPKPMVQDSIKVSNYFTGNMSASTGVAYSGDITFAELNYLRAHTFKKFSISYGAYGFAGRIKDSNTGSDYISDFKKKTFNGFGVRASANLNHTAGRVDFRYLGVETSYSKEFGEYAEFRKSSLTTTDRYSIARTDLFSAGLTSEIIWHHKKATSTQYGFRLFAGHTFGNTTFRSMNPNDMDNQELDYLRIAPARVSLSFFFKYRKTFFVYENQGFDSMKLGLGYRF